jgi:hypothetical protein
LYDSHVLFFKVNIRSPTDLIVNLKEKKNVDGKILFLKGKMDLILLHISSICFSNPRLDPYNPHYNVLDGGTVPELGGIEALKILKNLSNFKISH